MSPGTEHDGPIGRVVGHFRLVRVLGEGGMSTVYVAERTGDFQQTAAVKLLREGLLDAETRARFRAEQQVLASLRHPGIVQLIDGGVTAGGVPYLVMELVDGVPLDEYSRSRGLGVRARVELAIRVLEAVEYAHQRFLAHCDLKFSNILVTPGGQPQLLDFGVTKLLAPAQFGLEPLATRAETRPFTPEFASPEQLAGGNLGTATDIYSAGVVLYALLAGAHPFEAERAQPVELMRAIRHTQPPPPSRRAGGALERELRGDLDAIVLKALRKEPEQRYSSAAQFAHDLRNYLEGRPVEARRGSRRYRAAKFLKRNRVAAGAALLALLALLAGTAGVFWEGVRARGARRLAEARYQAARELTSSLLLDFYQAVGKLDHSEAAQRFLVERSSQTLDALARESGGEAAVECDLADTYWKLGNLQKGDAARSSYARGLALAEAALRARPADRRAMDAAARLRSAVGSVR
jgi:tRNA A-37 threonylcarbamoyl transferase component Bud32